MKNIRKTGFTLTELLTALGIVAVLVALLLPALSKVRAMSLDVKQKGQINAMEIGLEAFRTDFGVYPSSSNTDADGDTYYGSEKLAEALLGYDLLGVHKDVRPNFDKDGEDAAGDSLYDNAGAPINLDQRKGPYLETEKMSPVLSGDVDDIFNLAAGGHYISDVYSRDSLKNGLPVLYYRARPEKKIQNPSSGLTDDKVYDYSDCDMPFAAGLAGDKSAYTQGFSNIWGSNPVDAEFNFDAYIINSEISSNDVHIPFRAQSFILISAGADGVYGTTDDVTNFERN